VVQDWAASLPREKSQLFETVVRNWESSYAMLSVTLDDSLSMRARGELVCSRQQISITADLLRRLSSSLIACCMAVDHCARQIGRLPAVEPLNMGFFRGNTAQSAASWNGIIHHVLFGDRSRFFHKLRILSDTLRRLESEFSEAASEICSGNSVKPSTNMGTLDSLHYDFSTCLRETEVVFKSFLCALPDDQLSAFTADLLAPEAPRAHRSSQRLSRAPA
jgi:hypothetical protein